MVKTFAILTGSVFFLGFFSCGGGADQKKKGGKSAQCAKLFDKVTTCSKEIKLLEEMGKAFGSKDKFVSECKAHWKEAEEMTKCAGKSDCKDFAKCLLKMSDEDMKKMEELQRMADMPADAPAADMPADMPTE